MERIADADLLSASALAYIGDAVFTLFVRSELVKTYDYKSGELTLRASKIVSAAAQSKILSELEGFLSEEEKAIVKRCRNSHNNNFSKNASIGEYRRATGLEGLLGYLYLKNETRLNEVLNECLRVNKDGEGTIGT